MALIKCIECNAEISSLAKACPKCGRNMESLNYGTLNQKSPQQVKFENIVGFGIVGIIFVVIFLCCISSHKSDDEVNSDFQKTREWEIRRGDVR